MSGIEFLLFFIVGAVSGGMLLIVSFIEEQPLQKIFVATISGFDIVTLLTIGHLNFGMSYLAFFSGGIVGISIVVLMILVIWVFNKEKK